MPVALLLAMQAAGMITDYFGMQEQKRIGRLGYSIENAGIAANISLSKAQAEEASLASMQNLRQTLGSQIAMQAARGTSTSAGSSVSIFNDSISNFNSDKQARRMNLLAREANLRAQGVLSGLHQLTSETQMGQSLRKRFFENVSSNPSVYKQGFSGTSSTASGGNFGMTPVQG